MTNIELMRCLATLYARVYGRGIQISYNAQEKLFYVTTIKTVTLTRVGIETMIRRLESEA